jgi:hypothetical protein
MKKISAVIVGALVWIVVLPLAGLLVIFSLSTPGTKFGFFLLGYAASIAATLFASLAMSRIHEELTKDFRYIVIGITAVVWLGGGILLTLGSPDMGFKISSTIGSLLSILVMRNMMHVE